MIVWGWYAENDFRLPITIRFSFLFRNTILYCKIDFQEYVIFTSKSLLWIFLKHLSELYWQHYILSIFPCVTETHFLFQDPLFSIVEVSFCFRIMVQHVRLRVLNDILTKPFCYKKSVWNSSIHSYLLAYQTTAQDWRLMFHISFFSYCPCQHSSRIVFPIELINIGSTTAVSGFWWLKFHVFFKSKYKYCHDPHFWSSFCRQIIH